MKTEQITELLCQALETEKGGIQVYTTALSASSMPTSRRNGRSIRTDQEARAHRPRGDGKAPGSTRIGRTPGRLVVRHIGESLVEAMEMALGDGSGGGRADRRVRVRGRSRNEGPSELGADPRGR